MGQADKIYEYLSRSGNRAAEGLLKLGLNRAEEPYRTAILETMLDRNRVRPTADLIADYNVYPAHWKTLLIARLADLEGALLRAADSERLQTQLNAMSIIEKILTNPHTTPGCSIYRMAEPLALLLTKGDQTIAPWAAKWLISLTEQLFERMRSPADELYGLSAGELLLRPGRELLGKTLDIRNFLITLRDAIGSYHIHRRAEPVLAGMYLAMPDCEPFWRDMLQGQTLVGTLTAKLLSEIKSERLGPFCIAALKEKTLRAAAGEGIASARDGRIVLALACTAAEQTDKSTAKALKFIKQAQWLEPETIAAIEYSDSRGRLAMIRLIGSLGSESEPVGRCLAVFADDPDESAAIEAVGAIAKLPGQIAIAPLTAALSSRHEAAAMRAIEAISLNKPGHLAQIMAQQLGSPHERIRQLAAKYYKDKIFELYWHSFDELTVPQRSRIATAVFKIDPNARNRLLNYAGSRSAESRMRAITIARQLGRPGESIDMLGRLAKDDNRMVRSCAIAAMGYLDPADKPAVEEQLLEALDDVDTRVRANAIESMERLVIVEAAKKIEQFAGDANNRIRANAIKAMLTWRAISAGRAVRSMLDDPRPPHRKSAGWILRHLKK